MKNPDPRFGLDKIYIAGVARSAGVVSSAKYFGRSDHPVCASRCSAHPPLLCEEGNITHATRNPLPIRFKPGAVGARSNSSLVSDQLQARPVSSGFPFV